MIAVGCGRENCVRVRVVHARFLAISRRSDVCVRQIYRYREQNRKWMPVLTLSHPDIVHDVSWAPNVGRSYHLIATACKDKGVRIWRVEDDAAAEIYVSFEHQAEVWRVSWNVTGTVLSSSGDDGKVRLYRGAHIFVLHWHRSAHSAAPSADYMDEWHCTSVISPPNN